MSALMSAITDCAPVRLIDENRPRRIAELLAVVWLLSLADLGFTLWAHLYTPFLELNPIARAMLDQDLLQTLVAFKVGLTALATLIFWHLRHHVQVELAVWFLLGVYVALTLRWSTYTVNSLALAG